MSWRNEHTAVVMLALLGLGCPAEPTATTTTMATSSGASTEDSTADATTSTDTTADATDDTGTADSTGADSTGQPPVLCEDPQPILQRGLDVPTGFERCADGQVRRVAAVTCEVPVPQGSCFEQGGAGSECATDDECTDRPFGICGEVAYGFGIVCECIYGCQTDADCPQDHLCACGGDSPHYPQSTRCVPAHCMDSTECPDGLCRLGAHEYTCDRNYTLACTTPGDPCEQDEDCGVQESCHPQSGQWQCESGGCL